jgi:hypothetical protein
LFSRSFRDIALHGSSGDGYCLAFRGHALGGGLLQGENAVRLVYVDEAGISRKEPFVVVAAAIVHGDQKLNEIKRYFDRLVARHIPPEHQNEFVFHAKEIFGGGKIIKRNDPAWPDEKRFAIADDLAAIPQKFGLPIAMGFIEKATFPPSKTPLPFEISEKDKDVLPHVTSFLTCAMHVEQWVRRNASNENCLMVAENNDQAKKLIAATQRYHQEHRTEFLVGEEVRKHFPFRKIQEDPLFQNKRKSNPLQIADFCAYVFKRILMQDRRYDRFFGPFISQLVYAPEESMQNKRQRA